MAGGHGALLYVALIYIVNILLDIDVLFATSEVVAVGLVHVPYMHAHIHPHSFVSLASPDSFFKSTHAAG